MTKDNYANVIREMIRHEDDLLIGRTNWLMTLQGLLFAALAFAWDIERLPLVFIIFGALFSALFIPYLTFSERAIIKLLNLWKENSRDYDGPPLMGLEYKDVPAWYSRIWPWSWSPVVFIIAWLWIFIVWLTK